MSPQVFHILLSLADGERHGYAIIHDVRGRTGDEVRLTASTLYAALKRLLDEGWIEEVDGPDGSGPKRRHYRLTRKGAAAGKAEAQRLDDLARLAQAKRWVTRRRARS